MVSKIPWKKSLCSRNSATTTTIEAATFFPKFLKFWTLLSILSSPGLFDFFKSVLEVQFFPIIDIWGWKHRRLWSLMFDFSLTVFSLLFRRLNDLVLSLPCEEFLMFLIFRWFYLSLSEVSWRMNRGISILCNWRFGRKTMNVHCIEY